MKIMKRFLFIFILIMVVINGLLGCNATTGKENIAVGQEKNPKEKESIGMVAEEMMASLVDLGNGRFQYSIKNQTEKEKTFQFTSSQRFDYAVKTTKGQQVYLFSSVALFMNVLGEETLNPGNELTYDIDLTELNLEKGTYILEVWLTAEEAENYKKVTEFVVN